MSDALVLAGGLAKGAFAAGALAVLSKPAVKARLGLRFTRIVGASSGALCGVYYAAAVRRGEEAGAGARLAQIWIERGAARDAIGPSLTDALRGQGLSTERKLVQIMREELRPKPGSHPVEFRVVVTNADGIRVRVGAELETTFEQIADFRDSDFDEADSLERLYRAVAASLAMPGLFAPVPLDGASAMDGGLVDNAPLGCALQGASDIDRVFVVVPFPRVADSPVDLRGAALVSHVFDMLVQQRLFRDLRKVDRVNRSLAELSQRVPDPLQRAAILDVFGWTGRRPVRVVQIRPPAPLAGDAFSGLFSRALRERYVQAGVDAARSVVGGLAAT